MSRLIAISNRVQAAEAGENSNRGGLAVALSAALRSSNGVRFGWYGEQTDEFTGQISFRREDWVATATIDLEAQDIEENCNGFANRTLWPLFHDRLDYSKGLQERFLAYEQLLSNRPDLREKVFMLQIAPPSRGDVASYQQIRADLNSLSGGINGEFASIDWVPVRYVNKGYAREELFGIYRASRVGLVTPLRDGMNLVAKEYVAAQDPEDPGVLVLSRFAGASVQLDAALIINPHSSEDMADAIARALVMPLEERKQRHAAMLKSVVEEDVRWWSARFIEALEGQLPHESRPKLVLASSKP